MNQEHNPQNQINLDLSLGLPSPPPPPPPPQENTVFSNGFMQMLTSISDPPPYHMAAPPHGYYTTVIRPCNVPNPSEQLLGQPPQAGEAMSIEIPPYPWATTRPALIHTLRYLVSNNINIIYGQVHCKSCENTQTLEYNLREKFEELYSYIKENKEGLRQRAPPVWMSPKLTPCGSCQTSMKPVIGDNKEGINWLFLLLGQMLGCCTLEQLRYFCDKTSQHRTGSKDRVLYLTYLGLCKQLEPCDTFSLI
ncbi:unnamed protein product [Cochlearia groenlandica]